MLQSAVHQALRQGLGPSTFEDYGTFLKEAQSAAAKSSHPRLRETHIEGMCGEPRCEELVRLAESLQKAGEAA